MKQLATAQELAEYLNVPVSFVWNATRRGTLPHVRLPGGRRFIRFDLEEVLATLKEKTPV